MDRVKLLLKSKDGGLLSTRGIYMPTMTEVQVHTLHTDEAVCDYSTTDIDSIKSNFNHIENRDHAICNEVVETWKAMTFYCHSVHQEDSEDACTDGDGTQANPFTDLRHALRVISCVMGLFCWEVKSVLYVSGLVDYRFADTGYDFKSKLLIDWKDATVILRNVGYSWVGDKYSPTCIGGTLWQNMTASIDCKSLENEWWHEQEFALYNDVSMYKCNIEINSEIGIYIKDAIDCDIYVTNTKESGSAPDIFCRSASESKFKIKSNDTDSNILGGRFYTYNLYKSDIIASGCFNVEIHCCAIDSTFECLYFTGSYVYNSHITAMRAIRLNAGVVLSTITILNNGYISYGTDVMSAMYTSHNYIYIEKLVGGVDSNQSIALRSDVLEYNDIIAKVTDDIGITGEVCHTNTVRVEVDNSTETYGASGCVIAFDTLVNTNIVIIAETDQEHLPRINIEGVIVDKNTIDATIVGSNLSVVDMTPLHYRYHPDEEEIDPSGFNNSIKITFTHPFVFLDGRRSIHLLGAGSYAGSNVSYDNTTVSYTYTLGPRPSATDNMSVIDDIIVLSKGINYNQYGAVGTTVYYVESSTTYVSCSDCQTPVSTRYVREIIGTLNYDHRIVTSTETRKNEYTCGGSVYSRTCVDVGEAPVITQTTTRTDFKK